MSAGDVGDAPRVVPRADLDYAPPALLFASPLRSRRFLILGRVIIRLVEHDLARVEGHAVEIQRCFCTLPLGVVVARRDRVLHRHRDGEADSRRRDGGVAL